MLNQSDLQFLQGKIQDLGQALFFSQHSSLLRIPNTIVSILKVDDMGQMWFLVPRPRQVLHEFDREFPAKLEFFRKGKEFYLHAMGKAYIINDPEEINSLLDDDLRQQAMGDLVLIKVKMSKADYFDKAPSSHSGWWQDLRAQLHAWMFNTPRGYKPYNLDSPLQVAGW